MTAGWKLDRSQREALLAAHPACYANTVADHVTLSVKSPEMPGPVTDARIIGRADDGAGVEAYVVSIDGSTRRPDGGTWHITWSLADGRAARESNQVIADGGWTTIAPIALVLTPALW